jgi:hypothetical protein
VIGADASRPGKTAEAVEAVHQPIS